ncbi:SMI1/KNR4 family protein [Leifsonia sp. 21MFCrub1.1]|uniref:SMI1/KNR4 family protein n=1 Tax=Leifsonia sp. 21MFCrub1.1 TaxID=1798223 RepID=UPI000B7F056C|nr:SMI1/KNR4 family protein [Leifsonia sp. 21MFCrub1.1]
MSDIGPQLAALIKIAGAATQDEAGPPDARLAELGGSMELVELLRSRNGFYAFESALHVWGVGAVEGEDLREWNRESLWRYAFNGLDRGLTFFAEDIFGGQFGLAGSTVVSFDPETAERVVIAESLEEWAAKVLEDYALLTGHPLAHAWQEEYGALRAGYRLVPKVPFVLGGEYSLSNVVEMRDFEAMRARGALAARIHGSADGTSIEFEF